MKTLSAAVLLISSNAWAQRVITPAPSPLKSFVVESPAVFNKAVGSLKIPAAAAAALQVEGADLLKNGPVLMLAAPEAKTAAVLSRRWEGPAALVDWQKAVEITHPNNVFAEAGVAEALYRLKRGDTPVNDSWANRGLFNSLFDGATGRNADRNPPIEARYDVKGAVAWATSEGVTRPQGGGDELRSWNKKTGAMLRARIPARFHYYRLDYKPLPSGEVLAQFWTLKDKAAMGAFDPKKGTLRLLQGRASDIDMVASLMHPDGKRLVFLKKGSYSWEPTRTTLTTFDVNTGKRRQVVISRKLAFPALIELRAGGRHALVSAGSNENLRWLTVDLKTGKVLKDKPSRE